MYKTLLHKKHSILESVYGVQKCRRRFHPLEKCWDHLQEINYHACLQMPVIPMQRHEGPVGVCPGLDAWPQGGKRVRSTQWHLGRFYPAWDKVLDCAMAQEGRSQPMGMTL